MRSLLRAMVRPWRGQPGSFLLAKVLTPVANPQAIRRRSNPFYITALPLLLAACASNDAPELPPNTPPPPPPVVIRVPCVVDVDPRPAYPDSKDEMRGRPVDEQLRRFAAAREMRGPYEDQLERALAGCAGPP